MFSSTSVKDHRSTVSEDNTSNCSKLLSELENKLGDSSEGKENSNVKVSDKDKNKDNSGESAISHKSNTSNKSSDSNSKTQITLNAKVLDFHKNDMKFKSDIEKGVHHETKS